MRIVLIVHHRLDADSGAPGSTLELAERYRAAGHDVEVISFDDVGWGLRGRALQALFPVAVAWRLRRMRPRPDVVDASTGDLWLYARTRRPAGELVVTRSHGLEHMVAEAREADAGRRQRLTVRARLGAVAASLRAADLVFVLTAAERAYAVDRIGVEPGRVVVAPNGVGDRFVETPAPRPLGDGPFRVALIGALSARKGAAYAIPAVAAFLAAVPGAEASVIGVGRLEAEARRAFPADVRDRVRVVGRYRNEDLPELLAGHATLVFASLAEGFGKALVEGMACGLAPVATAVSGPSAIVRDGESGLLVPPRDAVALERALHRLHADRALLERLRRGAHARAQAFSWDRAVALRLEAYARARAER